MNYIIEILDEYKEEIIATKKAYTIEELKEFYKYKYKNFPYRIYEVIDIDL